MKWSVRLIAVPVSSVGQKDVRPIGDFEICTVEAVPDEMRPWLRECVKLSLEAMRAKQGAGCGG